jgi:hypothetical protein
MLVLRPTNDTGTSVEVSPEPKCVRCDAVLIYKPEHTEWYCSDCRHTPCRKELRKCAITSAATGNNGMLMPYEPLY